VILLRKAMRTIWRGKRSYIACVALMALGVMIYISMNLMYVNLYSAMNEMYRETRFADGFARMREMPMARVSSLERDDGIARMQGGLTTDARVTGLGGAGEIITLRLASYDPEDPQALNAFAMMRGSEPSEGEIIVGEPFFAAHNLALGDAIALVHGGREHSFIISGTALSPKYVYAIPDA